MLTWVPELNLWYYLWCPHLEPRAQDTALAESEGGRLLFFWRLVLHPAASWSPAIRARIHAPICGNEGLSGRNCFLWHRSHAICCMSAPSPCDPSPETRLLTTICSSASRSASRPAGLISWAARTSSFISLSWAACAHIWLVCCKVLQPLTRWIRVRVSVEQIRAALEDRTVLDPIATSYYVFFSYFRFSLELPAWRGISSQLW